MRAYEWAVVVLAVGLGMVTWAVPVEGGGQPWYLGPALFPRLVGLAVLGAGLACVLAGEGKDGRDAEQAGKAGVARAVVLAAGLAMAATLLERVGVTATAVLLTALGAGLLGAGVRAALVVSVVVGILVRVVFVGLLGVGR
jgi:hypothetical protein